MGKILSISCQSAVYTRLPLAGQKRRVSHRTKQEKGVYFGASESRKDGQAAGY